MKEFRFYQAEELGEALQLLSLNEDAWVLAGGTDVIPGFRRGEGPEALVDISSLNQLSYCKEEEGRIKIGGLTSHEKLKTSPLLKDKVKALAVAAGAIGSPQIRNRGTIGGNICHASPAADTLPPLMVLGASVTLKSRRGEREIEREIPLEQLFQGPYKTYVRADEILVEVSFPTPSPGTSTSFYKLGRREALAVARMSMAVSLFKNEEGIIERITIVPGAVTPVPVLMESAGNLLTGERPTPFLLERAGELVEEEMLSITGVRPSSLYKRPVIRTITRRTITAALEGRGDACR